MDWKLILLFVLLTVFSGILWFDNIRWTVRYWRKKPFDKSINAFSSEIINNPDNDNGDKKPKQVSVGLIEKTTESKNEATPKNKGYYSPSIFSRICFSHVKSIIRRLATKCKQNRVGGCLAMRKNIGSRSP